MLIFVSNLPPLIPEAWGATPIDESTVYLKGKS